MIYVKYTKMLCRYKQEDFDIWPHHTSHAEAMEGFGTF